MESHERIIVFQEKSIRRIWHEEEWWFSIVDVVEVLAGSPEPRKYWNKVKKKISEESELSPFWRQLKLPSSDGKKYATDCANRRGIMRIIMAVPSPNAEPFKQWLAQVGDERISEVEDPELAANRARDLYRAKGYPDEWIAARLKSIEIRRQLTDEWKARDVQEGKEYSILTAEIAKATFGLTPAEHKNLKSLKNHNLRDHMTNLELIFTMLGEEATKQVAIQDDAQGFDENQLAARKGGRGAGDARKRFEKTTGQTVVSKENFLKQIAAPEPSEPAVLPEGDTPEMP
jgi:DNA-damage-inducible protein D